MVSITKVIKAFEQYVKILRFGKSDVQTSEQVLPAGIESKPIPGMLASQSTTQASDKTLILGYIVKGKTKAGETRVFAQDLNGKELFYIYLKENGVCEMGGNMDYLVRFNKLESELKSLAAKISTEFTEVAAGMPPGGTYVPTTITIDISEAKIKNIKTS